MHDFTHGHGLRVTARGDALDHPVPADDALELAVLPADPQFPHAQLAHPVTRLPQGLSFADARHIRLRGLSRAAHRDPQLSPYRPSPGALPARWPLRVGWPIPAVPGQGPLCTSKERRLTLKGSPGSRGPAFVTIPGYPQQVRMTHGCG